MGFKFNESSGKTWSEQVGEYNEKLLEDQEMQPKEKTQIEIIQETLDMVIVSMLGGGGNV